MHFLLGLLFRAGLSWLLVFRLILWWRYVVIAQLHCYPFNVDVLEGIWLHDFILFM